MKKMKFFVIAGIVLVIGGLLLTPDESVPSHENESQIPQNANSMKGKDYNEIFSEFSDRGFTNIKAEKIEDLIFGWLTKDGEVEKVIIDGNEEYSADQWVNSDVEVIISYHTFPDKEKKEDVKENKQEINNEQEENDKQKQNDEQREIESDNVSEEIAKEDEEIYDYGKKIVMDYENSEFEKYWNADDAVDHFRQLGFENVDMNICSMPDGHTNEIYRINISTSKGMVGSWNSGDVFHSKDEIVVYYQLVKEPSYTENNEGTARQSDNVTYEDSNKNSSSASTGSTNKTQKSSSGGGAYVLNTNSRKFHKPNCASVSKMNSSNRQDVSWSRNEIIAAGYDPCKKCNP